MRVLALVPALYDTSPGQRFRIEQWAHYLQRDGFEFTFLPFEDEELHETIYRPGRYGRKAALMVSALARRLRELRRVPDYDLVYLYREAALVGPAFFERWIASHRVPIVYDFDDPIWLPYRSPSNGSLSRLKCHSKTAAICRMASAVIVGNQLLAKYARQHAKSVFVIPSTIDMERHPARPNRSNGQPITLGWTGSHSTLPFLESIHPPLRSLARRWDFRLLVVSHTDSYHVAGLPVFARRWQPASEADDLQEIDIGLAPFPDSGWTPWRCHGKILQYMAAAVPSVASPVGIVPDYIQEGVNGFCANSPDEWVNKLERLLSCPSLRLRLGAAARDTVEQKYSASVWAAAFGDILRTVANKGLVERRPE
ncbi:MAG TPA: glycosyltransferase family 4 protein [Pirellulaceae bacterium]|nr:glycosyltransferase family 4 protein [Pirellulaceae bacterium]